MNSSDSAIIQKMYEQASKEFLIPDRLDFDVILDYFYRVIIEDYEMDISDPKHAEIYSEMNLSVEDIVMNHFLAQFKYVNSFEQLEDSLLHTASSISNNMKIDALPESEKVPKYLREKISQIRMFGWVYFLKSDKELKNRKCGKWMYFFSDKYWAKRICLKAVDENIVCEAKYADDNNGVACFYLNADDNDRHKKVIRFFIENDLIKKTKSGKYTNIAFKLDKQTKAKEYGKDFNAVLHLSDFIDLETGEFIIHL